VSDKEPLVLACGDGQKVELCAPVQDGADEGSPRRMGGALDVVSPVGGGTTLTITAPLMPPWATGEDATRADF